MKNFWNKYTDLLGNTIFHPQYPMLSAIRDAVEEAKKKSHGKLIDLGCGRMQYRREFEPFIESYTGLDHPKISQDYRSKFSPDILADIHKLLIKKNTYDTAIMFQVVEYLEDAPKAFSQISRILKKGSYLIISTPFLYPVHDRGLDRNRYTDVAMRSMLMSSGFKVTRVIDHGNFVQFIVLSTNVLLLKTVKKLSSKYKVLILLLPVCLGLTTVLNLMAYFASLMISDRGSDFVINYTVVAKKN
jgi:SAM-dependent methyltransferase